MVENTRKVLFNSLTMKDNEGAGLMLQVNRISEGGTFNEGEISRIIDGKTAD